MSEIVTFDCEPPMRNDVYGENLCTLLQNMLPYNKKQVTSIVKKDTCPLSSTKGRKKMWMNVRGVGKLKDFASPY